MLQNKTALELNSDRSRSLEEKIWYFAFGSNMNPKILTGLRNVKPHQSKPAYFPGWYLNFDSHGIPFWEPSYASIGTEPMDPSQPEVHGVVHQITKKEYEKIRQTELGGGYDGTGFYNTIVISVTTYDGQKISANTLIQCPRTLFHGQFYPSKRYMELIEGGAQEYGLKPSYQDWLKTLPRYEPKSTLRHWVGQNLFMGLLTLCYFPILYPYMRKNPDHPPRWMFVISKWFIFALGHIYYFIFRPIFGPGAGETINKIKNK